MKKYKKCAPGETVNSIRRILCGYNILLKEDYRELYGFHSCRLTLSDPNLESFNIGTNGKGRSFEYAMASGYAEFMERLQNRVLFDNNLLYSFLDRCDLHKNIKEELSLEYLFDPKEVELDYECCIDKLREDGIRIFESSEEENKAIEEYMRNSVSLRNIILAPFYSVDKDEEIMLPIELCLLASGTNGMCAGNDRQEALIQGFCEIFERFAVKEIFFNQLILPTIDPNRFNGSKAGEMLSSLKRRGFNVIIKACSLGKKLPVIGALIIEPNGSMYNFKLGSDFVDSIALERCLTETFQSSSGFRGIPLAHRWADERDDSTMFKESNSAFDNFNRIISDGSGNWPSCIWQEADLIETFMYPQEYGESNASDLKIAIELIKELGFDIFIRDNSASEFPAMYIFIPGMSSTYCNSSHFAWNLSQDKLNDFGEISRLEDLDNEGLTNLVDKISKASDVDLKQINLSDYVKYNPLDDLRDIDIFQLATMIAYKNGDFCLSHQMAQKFISRHSGLPIYYVAVVKFLFFKSKGFENHKILEILSKIFGFEIANEILSDFERPEDIFQHHSFPKELANMSLRELQGVMTIVRILSILNKSFSERKVSQESLRSCFSNQ